MLVRRERGATRHRRGPRVRRFGVPVQPDASVICCAAVQRQYTGTAGRIENSQVAVFLGYATDAGHAFIDWEIYLPRVWASDTGRRQAGGVPAE